MKKFVCQVCGYVYEGEAAPAKCPQCGAPASKFQEMAAEMGWAAEHVVGVAQGASEEQLSTVYTPIGLDIGGETPEEIAVSIMAQIQQVRYDAPGGHLKGKDK